MVLLGGLTRLTDSGLSITAWEPLSGILPPLGDAEWERYLQEYRKIPEYQQINKGMSLSEFKEIFWLEYIHRLFGRIAGFVFFVPFVYFSVKGYLNKQTILKLVFIFALGGLQGFIGWYMVSSGLSVRTDVSQYRLAFHLITAFVIYALLLWTLLGFKCPKKREGRDKVVALYGTYLTGLIFFMIFLGALVAGTDAGFIYNTFPKMGEGYIPDEVYSMSPWWINHFENQAMIQLQHRIFAVWLFLEVIFFAIMLGSRNPQMKKYAVMLVAAIVLQAGLGISTLHLFAGQEEYFLANGYKKMFQASVIVAELHQLGALFLLSVNIIILHKLLRIPR